LVLLDFRFYWTFSVIFPVIFPTPLASSIYETYVFLKKRGKHKNVDTKMDTKWILKTI
jgi:hypothetical protein